MREKLSGGSGVGVLGRLHCEGVTGGRRSIWQVEDGGAAFQGEGTAGQRPGSREQHRLLENDVAGGGQGWERQLERQKGRSVKRLLLSAEGGWCVPSSTGVNRRQVQATQSTSGR